MRHYTIAVSVEPGRDWTATARLTVGCRTWVGTSHSNEEHAVKRAYRAWRRTTRHEARMHAEVTS